MKKTITILVFMFFTGPLSAGTQSLSFMRDGVGADLLATGSAGTAAAQGAEAGYWNPAGLSMMVACAYQLSTMYVIEQYDRHYAYLGGAMHTDAGTWGFNLLDYGVSNIQILDESGNEEGIQSDNEYSLGVTYSNKIAYLLSYGVTLRGNFQNLVGYSGIGFSFDIGVVYQPMLDQELYIGLMAQNVAGELFWSNYAESILSVYKAGLSYKFFNDSTRLSFDLVKDADYTYLICRGGVEFSVFEYFYLRGGLDDQYPTAGLGIKYDIYRIDYAYIYNRYGMGDNHVISLEITW